MDPTRPQEVVPYHTKLVEKKNDFTPTLALVASGASMILRNPLLGWLGLYLALTGYLNQSPREAEGAGASAFSTVILPASTLMTQYFPLFFPRRA